MQRKRAEDYRRSPLRALRSLFSIHMSIIVRPRNLIKNKSVASRLSKFYSDLPDNAPTLGENEQWLNSLSSNNRIGNLKRDYDNFARFPSNESFPWTFERDSTNPKKCIVNTPLSWLTDTKYLRQFNKNKHLQSNFVDVRIVKCTSGKGGDGCVSFFRDAGRSIGPPDGGDGGHGGSIYVQAESGLDSLAKMRATYVASDGGSGQSGQLDGARGKDILITVPTGTVIKWCLQPKLIKELMEERVNNGHYTDKIKNLLENEYYDLECFNDNRYMGELPSHIQMKRSSNTSSSWLFKEKDEQYHRDKEWFVQLDKKMRLYDYGVLKNELEADKFPLFGIDLSTPTKKPICLLKGGKGGLGNMHFLTNLIRNPRFAKHGRPGLDQYFLFELKMIADLGLVGLPNAGKSTLLTKISNAKPRIGHWEFTTLEPSVGTISLGIQGPQFTVADIPGIIKGASQDKGMGIEFLRHIERSNGWVFVISLENPHPLNDLNILINELGGQEIIKQKRVLVVANKADINHTSTESRDKYMRLKEFCDSKGWDSIPISALHSHNIDKLLVKMAKCSGRLSS